MSSPETPETAPTPPVEAAEPAAAGRSPIEKAIVWGLIGTGLVAAAIEGRARVGYQMTLDYIIEANKDDQDVPKSDKPTGNVSLTPPKLEAPDPDQKITASDFKNIDVKTTPAATMKGIRSEAFGKLAFLSPILTGSIDHPEEKAKGKLNHEATVTWFSIKDLFNPKPTYKIALTVTGGTDAAEIVVYSTSDAPEEAPKEIVAIDPSTGPSAASAAAFGGGNRRRRNRDRDRPDGDDKSDDKSDEKSDDEKSDDEKSDDEKKDASKKEDVKADKSKEDADHDPKQTSSEEPKKDDKPEDGKPEDGKEDK